MKSAEQSMNALADRPQATGVAVFLEDVSKSYRHFQLRGIDLAIERGTVTGLIGPNGAGKSTTMRIMMGLVRPDTGMVRVLGQPVSASEAAVRQDVGYFSEDMRLYKPESLGWHMQLVRSLFPTWDEEYARQLVRRFGLVEAQPVRGLSHGQRVKAMLLLILARRPRLLILDEPTNGLDPVARHEILSELMQVITDDQRTVIYSSHNTRDVEQICDQIVFIDRGTVIAADDRDRFLESWRRLRVQVPGDWKLPAIRGLSLESSVGNLRVLLTSHADERLPARLEAAGARLESSDPLSLEEIFVSTVTRGREELPS